MATQEEVENYRKMYPSIPVEDLFAKLNPKQLESAQAQTGIVRIIAGPGTGKTATMTTRTASIIQNDVDPRQCLSITFTNKAAEQLKDRVIDIAGYDGNFVATATFHGLARKYILNPNQNHEYIQNYGYKDGFVIIDPDDSKQLSKDAMKNLPKFIQHAFEALGLNEKNLMEEISLIRTNGTDHIDQRAEIKKDAESITQWDGFKRQFDHNITYTEEHEIKHQLEIVKQYIGNNPSVRDILTNKFWQSYTKSCIDVGGIDFDDMLVLATKLLLNDNNVAKKLASQFPYISIDEFQDTNPVQYQMIKTIVDNMKSPNLFTIGDPRQSIYKFRNAKVEIIMNLDEDYPDCKTIEMTQNYRSTNSVLESANMHAIGMNTQITDGQLSSGRDGNTKGTAPVQLQFSDDLDEASWIVDMIQKLKKSGKVGLGNISILYRANSVRKKIEDQLVKENVDYQVVGDISFYDRKEVKDIVNVLRAVIRSRDVIACGRMVDASDIRLAGVRLKRDCLAFNTPLDYIESLGKKGTPASQQFTDYARVIRGLKNVDDYSMTFEKFILQLDQGRTIEEAKRNIGALFDSTEEMDVFLNENHRTTIEEVFSPYREKLMAFWDKYLEPGLTKYIKAQKKDEDSTIELAERKLNVENVIQRLMNIAAETGSFSDAIDEMVLMAENSHMMNKDAVQLMTIHASKGLEFPIVIMAGCEEETFFRNPEDIDFETIDEESRIFYVGKTRAEKMVMYTSCDKRFVNGEEKHLTPVRFLKEDAAMSQIINKRKGAQMQARAEKEREESRQRGTTYSETNSSDGLRRQFNN
jgi:superfamily I DNA/RNA helicase